MTAKKLLSLTLNGKAFNPRPPKPTAVKLRAFLEKLPFNELLTTDELENRTGVSVRNQRHAPEVQKYKAKIRLPRRMTVWGSAKTIAEVLKNKELLA